VFKYWARASGQSVSRMLAARRRGFPAQDRVTLPAWLVTQPGGRASGWAVAGGPRLREHPRQERPRLLDVQQAGPSAWCCSSAARRGGESVTGLCHGCPGPRVPARRRHAQHLVNRTGPRYSLIANTRGKVPFQPSGFTQEYSLQ